MAVIYFSVTIEAPQEKVWALISEAKETEFWSPNIRDLAHEPAGPVQVGTIRKVRLEIHEKIQTLQTEVTHCDAPNFFTEIPRGITADWQKKVRGVQLTYRLEAEGEERTTLYFTGKYEPVGLIGKLLSKTIGEGMIRNTLKQNLERLKTYAETGRSV